MPNNELIEPDYAPSFNEFKFHADDSVNELINSLNTDVFDASEFKKSLFEVKDLIDCMNWAHGEKINEMQATIDALII